ncbi:RNA-binding protein 5/10 [Vigna unguiculata]|uniref:RNA-binding protein 5/10 n=1 Tax=Vigna unguiculata TaxID=3917 RepID=A0A4D6MZH5_VIGUN|nr:RNA-binding protein 5/10 [Vigna unguiculata]
MDSSPATRERENGSQGNEVQEDDYMGDLSQFLPSDAFDPPKISSSKKISSKKDPLVNPSRDRLKSLSWQERRKLERERKQQEEDEQTLAKVEAPIPQSNIGFKLLKQMGYTPGSALGKQGSGRAEPVGIEIRRSRAGVGLEDPHKEKRKKEEIMMNRKRRKEEDLMKEFGFRQKSQWQSKRVIINYNKAKAALDQLENREIVEPQKNDDDSEVEEEEEEEITEEACNLTITFSLIFLLTQFLVLIMFIAQNSMETEYKELNSVLMKLRDEFNYCLFCGCKYESSEALLDNCPGTNEDDH